jgi:hypothetical protein
VGLLELELGRVLDGDDPLEWGMDSESMFRKVVLPEPVPPEMRTFIRAFTHPSGR